MLTAASRSGSNGWLTKGTPGSAGGPPCSCRLFPVVVEGGASIFWSHVFLRRASTMPWVRARMPAATVSVAANLGRDDCTMAASVGRASPETTAPREEPIEAAAPLEKPLSSEESCPLSLAGSVVRVPRGPGG